VELALFGLDVGSTTTRAMMAVCPVVRNAVTGRNEVAPPRHREVFAPELTPFTAGDLNLPELDALVDGWLSRAGLAATDIGGGGALFTGLAARAKSIRRAVSLVRRKIKDAVVATAADPLLESWLAFMGGCRALSRAHPDRAFVHMDIGGGTSNLAVGQDGEVSAITCVNVGARHFTFDQGTYRLASITEWGAAALSEAGIERRVGGALTRPEVDRLVGAWVGKLERACAEIAGESAVRTFSGGVGELIYHLAGGGALTPAAFGDLGGELARALLASPLGRDARAFVPPERGHATVIGLTLKATTVSGATIHLPRREVLPLSDVPIVSRLPAAAPRARFVQALALAAASPSGAALCVALQGETAAEARALGETVAGALDDAAVPPGRPVVLLLDRDLAKVVGQYASRWGASPASLIVLDEVFDARARFVNLGSVRHGTVPVSFHGL
jgi:ethanolamine utilization protein EutA